MCVTECVQYADMLVSRNIGSVTASHEPSAVVGFAEEPFSRHRRLISKATMKGMESLLLFITKCFTVPHKCEELAKFVPHILVKLAEFVDFNYELIRIFTALYLNTLKTNPKKYDLYLCSLGF